MNIWRWSRQMAAARGGDAIHSTQAAKEVVELMETIVRARTPAKEVRSDAEFLA